MDGPGIDLAQQGISNLKAEGSAARMPYWLSLLADLLTRGDRTDAARATLDAAVVAARAHDDLWWLPEVMRLRAAMTTRRRLSRAWNPLRGWRRRTAASRCSGAASVTSAHLVSALPGPAFSRPPSGRVRTRTLRERGGF